MINTIKARNAFSILFYFFLSLFNLYASANGAFSPLSFYPHNKKLEIIRFYTLGTEIDSRIIKRPFCKDLNVLYTNHETLGNNIVVVSGLYPLLLPQFLSNDLDEDTIEIQGFCLAQILLDKHTFECLFGYFETMNIYEEVKKYLLPTSTKSEGKSMVLEKKTVDASIKYAECLSKLYNDFILYQNAFLKYMDSLKLYVQYICELRNVRDSNSVVLKIDDFKSKISKLTKEDVIQIKSLFDEVLVAAVREYVHSETAFLFLCKEKKLPLPAILFTTRDMCHVCEATLVKAAESPIIVVSTREHDDSWKRHTVGAKVKKVVIDTDVKFNLVFSSSTNSSKTDEIVSEYQKLCSVRGISLLFQDATIPDGLKPLFEISKDDFYLASAKTKIKRNLIASYAIDSKLATLAILIRIYQCVFSEMFMGIKNNIIGETRAMLLSPSFSHMNQQLLVNYLDHIVSKLKPAFVRSRYINH